jgi:hypothetical protein
MFLRQDYKKRSVFLYLCFAIIILIGIAGYIKYRYTAIRNTATTAKNQSIPDNLSTQGFSFTNYVNGRPSFSIKVGDLSIKREKFKFFQFALLKVAEMKDIEINFYQPRNNEGAANNKFDFDLEQVFQTTLQKEVLHLNKVYRVSLDTIKINVYQTDRLIWSLQSKLADVNFRSASIKFSTDVKISNLIDNKTLACDKLGYLLRSKRFITPNDYVFSNQGNILRGKGINADYSLNQVYIPDQKAN